MPNVFTGALYGLDMAVSQIGVGCPGCVVEFLAESRIQGVVAVGKRYILSLCKGDSGIPGRTGAAIGLSCTKNAVQPVFRRQRTRHLKAVVAAVVIYKDKLHIINRALLPEIVKKTWEELRGVIKGYYQGYVIHLLCL